MDTFVINGGKKLTGTAEVYSAKNSVLALLAASILTEESVTIHKCPAITDVFNMLKILESLGCKIQWQGDSVTIDSQHASVHEIPAHYAKEIRSSIFMLGSILGRFKRAKAVFPGGCEIGLRPIDLHLKGLRMLGVEVREFGGYIECDASRAKGSEIHFDFPSVGATENIMLAAVLAEGNTTLTNAAREPEIVALEHFLNAMGADVSGAGTSTIHIRGVAKLHGVEFLPIPDRIVAGTYLIAAAITGGEMEITNVRPADLEALISKLDGNACDIKNYSDRMIVKGYRRPVGAQLVETSPYPGFPTDLQAQMMALQTISDGICVIEENMFETRFKHVPELMKMGANIIVRDRIAIVRGVERLYGADVRASDLRGGAGLVLAALCAEGTTTISNVRQIDRGYVRLDEVLSRLGADIRRVNR